MMLFKICAAALCIAAVVAEPPVNNGYLPPVTGRPGYNYPTPGQPLPTPTQPPYRPSPGPTYGPPPPPPPRPTYGPPPTARPPPPPPRPTYGPPPTARPPPPPPRPTYGPPATARPPAYVPPSPTPGYRPPGPTYGPPTGPSYPVTGSGTNFRPVNQPIQNDLPGTGPTSGGHDHGDHHHHEPGMPFDFNYAVKDDYYGTDYKHNAVSDGDVVRGEYQVLLPDGRLQIVSYTADWKNGFNADVKYQGEPTYPAPNTNQNRPAGNYQPSGPAGYPAPASGPY